MEMTVAVQDERGFVARTQLDYIRVLRVDESLTAVCESLVLRAVNGVDRDTVNAVETNDSTLQRKSNNT